MEKIEPAKPNLKDKDNFSKPSENYYKYSGSIKNRRLNDSEQKMIELVGKSTKILQMIMVILKSFLIRRFVEVLINFKRNFLILKLRECRY